MLRSYWSLALSFSLCPAHILILRTLLSGTSSCSGNTEHVDFHQRQKTLPESEDINILLLYFSVTYIVCTAYLIEMYDTGLEKTCSGE